jgi:hypothetical protein
MFVEGSEVEYQGHFGIIDFQCDDYSVLKLPAVGKGNNPARLLIFKKYYSKVTVLKDSGR